MYAKHKEAEKWLGTEEYDFRERELCSKTRAIKVGQADDCVVLAGATTNPFTGYLELTPIGPRTTFGGDAI